MTAEMIEAKVSEMENDIKEIKADIKDMPEKISVKINENIDIKIKGTFCPFPPFQIVTKVVVFMDIPKKNALFA